MWWSATRSVELFLNVAATCVAAAMLGLVLSALARSNEQIMPLLVVLVISQLVFCGGMIPVAHRLLLDQLSWFTPARWGFAASASTVDLTKLVPQAVGAHRFALGAHPEGVDLRHGHARAAVHRLRHVRPLEDPAQGRVGPGTRSAGLVGELVQLARGQIRVPPRGALRQLHTSRRVRCQQPVLHVIEDPCQHEPNATHAAASSLAFPFKFTPYPHPFRCPQHGQICDFRRRGVA